MADATKFAFDKNGKVIGVINKNGDVVDKNGKVIGNITPDGSIIDKNGKVIGKTAQEKYVYDESGNIIGRVLADGTVVDEEGNVTGKLLPDGTVVGLEGSILGYADAKNLVYDDNGNVMGRLLPDGTVVSLGGSLLGYVNANGEAVDENGTVIGTTDKANLVYDEQGNVIGKVLPDGTVVDMEGNIIGKALPDGTVVDKNGKVIGKANVSHLSFDEDGNVVGTIQADGTVIDKDGKVIGKVTSDGTVIDKNGNVVGSVDASNLVYDEEGNIMGRILPDGTVVDKNGKVIGRAQADGTVVDMNGNTMGYRGKNKFTEPVVSTDKRKIWFSRSREKTSTDKLSTEKNLPQIGVSVSKSSTKRQTLGVALTPDGEYLGDIMEDGVVINKEGKNIGRRTSDGLIVDNEGGLIGIEEVARDENVYGEKQPSSEMFIPQGTFGIGGAYGTGTGAGTNLGPGGGFGPGERYDPQRAAALGAAQQMRRSGMQVGKISSNVDKSSFDGMQADWSEQGIAKTMSSWRVDMSEMILADKPIPAVIARSIDSNNPTPVSAYVERNVYAEEGRNVIIPAGSHLIGTLGGLTGTSETTSVSAKVQITWERLIRPDGSMFKFGGLTGDAQGRGGALGYLDQQLFKKYTMPIMTTALTSYASYMMADDENTSNETETPKQQAANDARESFLDDMNQIFEQILQDKANIKPLTYVPAGTRIIIYPNTDLWIRTEDRNPKGSGVAEDKGARPLIDDKAVAQERANNAAAGQVVYNGEEAAAPVAAAGSSPKLIDDAKPAASAPVGSLPPAPPPPSLNGGAATTSSSSEGVPQLF